MPVMYHDIELTPGELQLLCILISSEMYAVTVPYNILEGTTYHCQVFENKEIRITRGDLD